MFKNLHKNKEVFDTTMKQFKKELKAMLSDEKKAPKDYSKLSKSAPSKFVKNKIKGIQSDERKHYRILKKIKAKYKL